MLRDIDAELTRYVATGVEGKLRPHSRAVYGYALPAGIKFAIVFIGTLAMSWGLTIMLRRIPFVARMI